MKKSGKVNKTPMDAPEIKLDEAFWKMARIVDTKQRKTSVHLRVDPETVEFFRESGPGHLSRMAKILKAYADTQSKY
jgi:uncharacterized protein (DUF4415 family)